MSVPLSLIEWFQNWYKEQCNGEWEHVHGVTIETLGTPGWQVTIDLEGTQLEGVPMPIARRERSAQDWIECCVEHNQFRGEGDPLKLAAIVHHFRQWILKNIPEKPTREGQVE